MSHFPKLFSTCLRLEVSVFEPFFINSQFKATGEPGIFEYNKRISSKSLLWFTLVLLILTGPSFSARFRHSEATTEELTTEEEYSDETEPTKPETGKSVIFLFSY